MWLVDGARPKKKSQDILALFYIKKFYRLLSPIREYQELPAGSILTEIKDQNRS